MQVMRSFLLLGVVLASVFPAEAKTIHVVIENLAFKPSKIEAKVGDILEWDNRDAILHSATVKGGFDIKLPPKKIIRQELKTVQSVKYYCRFHPDMTGSLVVKP
ncbi:cupredoxin domain-containing protein [Ochrobactrum teleogrylli]|uniref:Amicyanin n=1 Tax=Ochrobactrum teleogrylli TaxID=2479765 RepID=A0ABY2Y031_9HYPH|nr:cupredoxin domain-containing protein [[Ochrobactrum] teleogrylli]TNV10126.1 amicyanin [[Ochrobactrum] teleogrylli]